MAVVPAVRLFVEPLQEALRASGRARAAPRTPRLVRGLPDAAPAAGRGRSGKAAAFVRLAAPRRLVESSSAPVFRVPMRRSARRAVRDRPRLAGRAPALPGPGSPRRAWPAIGPVRVPTGEGRAWPCSSNSVRSGSPCRRKEDLDGDQDRLRSGRRHRDAGRRGLAWPRSVAQLNDQFISRPEEETGCRGGCAIRGGAARFQTLARMGLSVRGQRHPNKGLPVLYDNTQSKRLDARPMWRAGRGRRGDGRVPPPCGAGGAGVISPVFVFERPANTGAITSGGRFDGPRTIGLGAPRKVGALEGTRSVTDPKPGGPWGGRR